MSSGIWSRCPTYSLVSLSISRQWTGNSCRCLPVLSANTIGLLLFFGLFFSMCTCNGYCNKAQIFEPRRHSNTSSIKACRVGIISRKKNSWKGSLIYKHLIFQEQQRYVFMHMYAYLRTRMCTCAWLYMHLCLRISVCVKHSLKTRALHRHLGEDWFSDGKIPPKPQSTFPTMCSALYLSAFPI